MEDMKIKVYVEVNENNEITQVASSAFLTDTTDWILVDEGTGDKYAHAQGNYLDKRLHDEKGRYNYRLIDGAVVEIPEDEKPVIETVEQTSTEARLRTIEETVNALLGVEV